VQCLDLTSMDFFVHSREAPGTEALRDDDDLLEEHWLYVDGFADTMIARGPTLAPDRETATGSLHVLGLPSLAAATEFVEREPNNRAGVYAEHRIWPSRTCSGARCGSSSETSMSIASSSSRTRVTISARTCRRARLRHSERSCASG
jgi:uncharacterized protein YciI